MLSELREVVSVEEVSFEVLIFMISYDSILNMFNSLIK